MEFFVAVCPCHLLTVGWLLVSAWTDHVHGVREKGSLVTSLGAPPGKKRSGEQSQISWAYYECLDRPYA